MVEEETRDSRREGLHVIIASEKQESARMERGQ